jgi:hypothetical protein
MVESLKDEFKTINEMNAKINNATKHPESEQVSKYKFDN